MPVRGAMKNPEIVPEAPALARCLLDLDIEPLAQRRLMALRGGLLGALRRGPFEPTPWSALRRCTARFGLGFSAPSS